MSVLISTMVRINKCNPHKQKLVGEQKLVGALNKFKRAKTQKPKCLASRNIFLYLIIISDY